jgi:hypothetical protein
VLLSAVRAAADNGAGRAGGAAAEGACRPDPVRLRLMSLVASHEGGEACVCDLNGLSPHGHQIGGDGVMDSAGGLMACDIQTRRQISQYALTSAVQRLT